MNNCKECGTHTSNPKFCSRSCSVKFNNRGQNRTKDRKCINCGGQRERHSKKYCSQECHKEYEWRKRKLLIESGDFTLDHRLYKRYLIEKYGESCQECGWAKRNPTSGNIPIELEHIDGDSANNSLDNLKLLCPNCHSLTPTYKSLNVGNGRHYRKERYAAGKSY